MASSADIRPRKGRREFLAFLRYRRTLYPPKVRIGLVLDNFSPHAWRNRNAHDRRFREIVNWAKVA